LVYDIFVITFDPKHNRMAKEIEYRFLCNVFVNYLIVHEAGTKISQGYLHVDKNQQIRVRLVSDTSQGIKNTAWICVKHMYGVERDEFEYQIPYEDGVKLYNKCQFKFVKTRYSDKTSEGFPVDIDEYEDGQILAEVELPTKETLFTKPMYFGDNVTGVHKYCNYAFAGIPESSYQ
jgi:adenylate cyclase